MMKEYNVKQHYETLHKLQFEKHSGKSWIDVVISLKSECQTKKNDLSNFIKAQTASTAASYKIALMWLGEIDHLGMANC